jgi:hypothetical protein
VGEVNNMPANIFRTKNGIDIRTFSVADSIEDVLENEYWISGYGDPDGACSVVIHDPVGSDSSDKPPMRGYGKAETLERACARALFTYVLREDRGMDYVSEDDFYESKKGVVPFPIKPSRLDYVVKEGDLRLVQGKNRIIARSNYYTNQSDSSPLIEVYGPDALTALGRLASAYVFDETIRERTESLPATNFINEPPRGLV